MKLKSTTFYTFLCVLLFMLFKGDATGFYLAETNNISVSTHLTSDAGYSVQAKHSVTEHAFMHYRIAEEEEEFCSLDIHTIFRQLSCIPEFTLTAIDYLVQVQTCTDAFTSRRYLLFGVFRI